MKRFILMVFVLFVAVNAAPKPSYDLVDDDQSLGKPRNERWSRAAPKVKERKKVKDEDTDTSPDDDMDIELPKLEERAEEFILSELFRQNDQSGGASLRQERLANVPVREGKKVLYKGPITTTNHVEAAKVAVAKTEKNTKMDASARVDDELDDDDQGPNVGEIVYNQVDRQYPRKKLSKDYEKRERRNNENPDTKEDSDGDKGLDEVRNRTDIQDEDEAGKKSKDVRKRQQKTKENEDLSTNEDDEDDDEDNQSGKKTRYRKKSKDVKKRQERKNNNEDVDTNEDAEDDDDDNQSGKKTRYKKKSKDCKKRQERRKKEDLDTNEDDEDDDDVDQSGKKTRKRSKDARKRQERRKKNDNLDTNEDDEDDDDDDQDDKKTRYRQCSEDGRKRQERRQKNEDSDTDEDEEADDTELAQNRWYWKRKELMKYLKGLVIHIGDQDYDDANQGGFRRWYSKQFKNNRKRQQKLKKNKKTEDPPVVQGYAYAVLGAK